MKKLLVHMMVIMLIVSGVGICGFENAEAYASVKTPGKVTKLTLDDDESWVSESVSFSDINKAWNERKIRGIYRIACLKWKRVKGADGYKIYMSTVSSKKGYKCVKDVGKEGFWGSKKGIVESGGIEYKGTKKARVWFKVRAYKKNGKGYRYGKYSKPHKVVMLQRPIITPIKDEDNEITIKWKKVYFAEKYEVNIAEESDVNNYIAEHNKKYPNKKWPSRYYKGFLAVSTKIKTTGNKVDYTLPKEGIYLIHVRAVNGKDKSEVEYDYVYYDWWVD